MTPLRAFWETSGRRSGNRAQAPNDPLAGRPQEDWPGSEAEGDPTLGFPAAGCDRIPDRKERQPQGAFG